MSTTMAVSDAAPPTPVANFMAFVVSSPINLYNLNRQDHVLGDTSWAGLAGARVSGYVAGGKAIVELPRPQHRNHLMARGW